MSSFVLTPAPVKAPAPQPQQKKLLHRTSDPELSEHDLDDAVDMGEHAGWTSLGEPIYAEKDLEVFRPAPKQSTLPVYFVKGWLPVSADTLFNALMDARYRAGWDSNIRQLSVLDRKCDGDVMYAAVNLPWPLSNRDYVYHRRVKFFAHEHAFVVVCQSAHHASAPECNGLVRVETYALRMCIRASSGSNDACDFYVEYEDDTDFCIPNYGISFLLHTMLPSFMNNLRAACAEYAHYIKKLDDNEIQGIPSQVVRFRSEKRRRQSGSAIGSNGNLSDSQSSQSTTSSKASKLLRLTRPRKLFMSRKRRAVLRAESDSEHNYSSYSEPSIALTIQPEISSSTRSREARRVFRKSISMSSNDRHILRFSREAQSTTHTDDFVVEFQKQKVGLHLETDLFSNKVLVAYCEKGSEADKCSHRLEPGVVVTSVNGVPVTDFKFNEVLGEIKRARRPLLLGFSYPDEHSPKMKNRRSKEPKSVMKCVVSRDEHNLLRALRPLDEAAGVSAVLKHDTKVPAYSKKALRLHASNSSGATAPGVEYVMLPQGYLLYEIDGCYASDLTFAEIAHLLNRNNDSRVVSFKPALAVEGDRVAEAAARTVLSKRLSGTFRWGNFSFDDGAVTSSTASSRTDSSPPNSLKTAASDDSILSDAAAPIASIDKLADGSVTTGVVPEVAASDVKFGDASPSLCLPDYSAVTVTAKNVSWAWQHVHLLKADERIFSAALLIEKIEAFLSSAKATGVETATAKTVQKAMLDASDFVTRIKDRRAAGADILAEFSSESADDGWQFGQSHFGVTTYWKPAEDGSIWLKIDGSVQGVDLFNTVAVLREIDLWHTWFPFCNQSLVLQQIGHADYVPYLCISSPVLQRDAVLKVCAINACYERRCILMAGNSVEEESLPSSIKVPTCKGWSAGRMEINGFRALVEPLSRTHARTSIVTNIDPKCAIPKPMLNFGIKKMAGILLFLIRKEAEKIEKAQHDGASNEHLSRIHGDPTQFYAWLRPLVDRFLDDQQCDVLPPMLLLSPSEPAVRTPSVESPRSKGSPLPLQARKYSRTAAFHREMNAVAARADHEMLVPKRFVLDYLYDFGIWPYVLLLAVFSDVTPDAPFLRVCALKLVFTCACTWLGVPGAFSWQTRQRKRAQRELGPLQQRFVVLAGMLDVVNSWAMRAWVNWVQCYAQLLVERARADACFMRSPIETRDAENSWLLGSAFVFASVVVGVQVVVNI